MKSFYQEDFDGLDFSKQPLEMGEYEDCTFRNCHSGSVPMAKCSFLDCQFIDCDLSNSLLDQMALKNVDFQACKLLGLRFDYCNDFLFEVSFSDCLLNHSAFTGKKMVATKFHSCQLQDVDFSQCDLKASHWDSCDLAGAVFDHTNLEKANFQTAVNFEINPEINSIKQAVFSNNALGGLLRHLKIKIIH